MRLIIVGCEYSGVTTLINELYDWGNERGVHHPLDDHFTILDAYHLSQEEQNGMKNILYLVYGNFINQVESLMDHIGIFGVLNKK